MKNSNTWRVKIVGTLSELWYGGIGVDDVSITGCTGKKHGNHTVMNTQLC